MERRDSRRKGFCSGLSVNHDRAFSFDSTPIPSFRDDREIRRLLKPAPCGTFLTYSHPYPLFYDNQQLTNLLVELYSLWYPSKPPYREALESLWQDLPVSSAWKQGIEQQLAFPVNVGLPLFAPSALNNFGDLQIYIESRPEYVASDSLSRAAADDVVAKMRDLLRSQRGEAMEGPIELEIPCVAVIAKVEG